MKQKKWLKPLLFVLGAALVIVGVILFLPTILKVLDFLIKLFLPFILGYIFSMAVNPLADFLHRKLKLPRGVSAVLVMVLIIGILGSLLGMVIWKIVSEIRLIYDQFPVIYANIKTAVQIAGDKLSVLYGNMPVNVQDSIASFGDSISLKLSDTINNASMPLMDNASNFAKALPGVFVGVVVFILSSYFMVTNHKKVSGAVEKCVGEKFMIRLIEVKKQLGIYLGGYCKAQGILLVISFVIMIIGFAIINVNFALIIALVIAIIDALPFFGSGLVFIPWIAITLISGNFKFGIALWIIYTILFLVRRFAEPKLVSSGVNMNPILVLMSMYIGYKLISLGGLILGPIILMFIISLYKAGVFDGIIKSVKDLGEFIKKQFLQFKQFLLNLMESDWDE